MPNMQQNPDGTWSNAQPIGPIGSIARLEDRMRRRGHHRIARALAWLDELPLR